jgi:hypothetical protein
MQQTEQEKSILHVLVCKMIKNIIFLSKIFCGMGEKQYLCTLIVNGCISAIKTRF